MKNTLLVTIALQRCLKMLPVATSSYSSLSLDRAAAAAAARPIFTPRWDHSDYTNLLRNPPVSLRAAKKLAAVRLV